MSAGLRRWLLAPIIASLLLSACARATRVDTVAVSDQLRSLLQLHTCEYLYRDIVYFGEEKSFLFIKTVDRAVLFAVDIRVRAGVDLSEGLALTLDRHDRERVYVRLPASVILSVDAEEASIEEYFIREQGGRIGLLELTGQLDDVKKRTARAAVERGILDQADANARQMVRSFLELAGFTEVVFAGRTTDETEIQG